MTLAIVQLLQRIFTACQRSLMKCKIDCSVVSWGGRADMFPCVSFQPPGSSGVSGSATSSPASCASTILWCVWGDWAAATVGEGDGRRREASKAHLGKIAHGVFLSCCGVPRSYETWPLPVPLDRYGGVSARSGSRLVRSTRLSVCQSRGRDR